MSRSTVRATLHDAHSSQRLIHRELTAQREESGTISSYLCKQLREPHRFDHMFIACGMALFGKHGLHGSRLAAHDLDVIAAASDTGRQFLEAKRINSRRSPQRCGSGGGHKSSSATASSAS